MNWEFDNQGQWEADSQKLMDEELPYVYRILVCADGTFDITGSDDELGLSGRQTCDSFDEATAACEARERELIAAK